jgi:hypothetical protein
LVEDLASAAGAFEEKIKTAMSDSTRIRVEPPKKENLPQWIVDFFFLPFPFHLTGLSGTFLRSAWFLFSFVVRRGSGVLSPATYAHPLSSPFSGRHNTNITTHNIHGRPSGLGFEPC